MHAEDHHDRGPPSRSQLRPATATLHINSKTYTFRKGFCQQSKASGSFQLDLGTTIIGVKGNAGRPNFSMPISTHLHTAFGSGSVFGAEYGGKDILGGDSLIKARGTSHQGDVLLECCLRRRSPAHGTATVPSGRRRDVGARSRDRPGGAPRVRRQHPALLPELGRRRQDHAPSTRAHVRHRRADVRGSSPPSTPRRETSRASSTRFAG